MGGAPLGRLAAGPRAASRTSPSDAIQARSRARTSERERGSVNAQAPKATAVGWNELDRRAVDTVRVLAADAVEKVGNGHPGTAISLAPVAYLLYQQVMNVDPSDKDWLGRDRFV